MTSALEPRDRLLASFGRRQGRRLRTGKRTLVDTLLPTIQLSLDEVVQWQSGKAAELFNHLTTQPLNHVFLEIGFGGGEHLAHQAMLHPDIGMIGCEPYINGIGDLLKKIDAQKIRNIRVFPNDARLLIEKLPDRCLDKVFILYPDPWPKSRHHKRRLISMAFLDDLARVMKPGAALQLATDHADYAAWMLERLLAHPKFTWTAQACADWLNPPPDWIPTKYEQKALAGRPTYLNFRLS